MTAVICAAIKNTSFNIKSPCFYYVAKQHFRQIDLNDKINMQNKCQFYRNLIDVMRDQKDMIGWENGNFLH